MRQNTPNSMAVQYLPNGDRALTICLSDKVSIPNNRMVNALKRAFEDSPVKGVTELLPTYCALTVFYDPIAIGYTELVTACKQRVSQIERYLNSSAADEWVLEVPVLYGGEWGFDLPDVAAYHNMTEQQIIDIHTGYPFYTYMLGFTPGHGYLASENPLTIPRRSSPRACVTAGSVVVMQNMSVIEPIDSPNGWNVIGKTPLRVFNMADEDPFVIKQGLWVQFKSIDRKEYDRIEQQVQSGTYQLVLRRKEK